MLLPNDHRPCLIPPLGFQGSSTIPLRHAQVLIQPQLYREPLRHCFCWEARCHDFVVVAHCVLTKITSSSPLQVLLGCCSSTTFAACADRSLLLLLTVRLSPLRERLFWRVGYECTVFKQTIKMLNHVAEANAEAWVSLCRLEQHFSILYLYVVSTFLLDSDRCALPVVLLTTSLLSSEHMTLYADTTRRHFDTPQPRFELKSSLKKRKPPPACAELRER